MTHYVIDEDLDKKSKEEEQEEENNLNFEEFIFSSFNPKTKEMLEDLKKEDKDFDQKIDNILLKLEDGDDLTLIQSEILIFIKDKYKEIRKKNKSLESEIDEKKSKKILNQIRELSQYLINQKSQISRNISKDLVKPKDKYQYLSQESLKNLKSTIRRFVIYQIYMAVNPHRIAGETRKQTFIHNVILRGMEQAKHYEGGSESEIKSYGAKMIRNLENKHIKFNKNKNLFR
jgi:hypothetical protein